VSGVEGPESPATGLAGALLRTRSATAAERSDGV